MWSIFCRGKNPWMAIDFHKKKKHKSQKVLLFRYLWVEKRSFANLRDYVRERDTSSLQEQTIESAAVTSRMDDGKRGKKKSRRRLDERGAKVRVVMGRREMRVRDFNFPFNLAYYHSLWKLPRIYYLKTHFNNPDSIVCIHFWVAHIQSTCSGNIPSAVVYRTYWNRS